jgi:hypothetical protein
MENQNVNHNEKDKSLVVFSEDLKLPIQALSLTSLGNSFHAMDAK